MIHDTNVLLPARVSRPDDRFRGRGVLCAAGLDDVETLEFGNLDELRAIRRCDLSCAARWLTARIGLLPGQHVFAFLVGVFTVAWVPSDWIRLATLYATPYSGLTLALLLRKPSMTKDEGRTTNDQV